MPAHARQAKQHGKRPQLSNLSHKFPIPTHPSSGCKSPDRYRRISELTTESVVNKYFSFHLLCEFMFSLQYSHQKAICHPFEKEVNFSSVRMATYQTKMTSTLPIFPVAVERTVVRRRTARYRGHIEFLGGWYED